MYIFAASVELSLPTLTLKEKRGIVKSLMGRMRNRFNVAVAEVEGLDDRGRGVLGIVTVSNSRPYARGLLERVERWLIEERPDIEVSRFEIEEC
ncbi:MAG: DUF503 domain-containing protein [Desulfuromonadia bacterium]